MAEASVTVGTSREQHEPALPEVRQHILPSPRRSALLDPQVAQQPVERLAVGVLLPRAKLTTYAGKSAK
jgi:hypothetical protein